MQNLSSQLSGKNTKVFQKASVFAFFPEKAYIYPRNTLFSLTMKNVLITDDHGIVRLGASILVEKTIKDAQISQAEDFEEMITLLKQQNFDLMLLDINMPGGNNIKMLEEILAIQPDLKILVVSSYEESIYALRYIMAGASGYVNKNSSKQNLIDAISQVAEGKKYMSAEIKEMYFNSLVNGKSSKIENNPLNLLSNREMDVSKHLIKGESIQDVAKALNLKNSTVSTYKTRVFEKLQIENIADLIEIFRLHDNL